MVHLMATLMETLMVLSKGLLCIEAKELPLLLP
jgi:hypothetical protein